MEDEFSSRLHVDVSLTNKLVQAIQGFFKKAGRKKAVVGLSGGVDSAVTCALLARALGAKNVFAYHFPYWKNEEDERHARHVAEQVGVRLEVRSIPSVVDSFVSVSKTDDEVAKGNFMARTRMALLYHFAREKDALVVGTGNRTEFLVGYFTKFGDGAADFFPLANLYKGQVKNLAGMLHVPRDIIEKVPSAGLWSGQTDEGELGITYAEMDRILVAYTDLKWKKEKVARQFGKAMTEKVIRRVHAFEHKRLPPGMPNR